MFARLIAEFPDVDLKRFDFSGNQFNAARI
jgi:hypothetical protein